MDLAPRFCSQPARRNDDALRPGEHIVVSVTLPMETQTLELVRFAGTVAHGRDGELRERAAALREAGTPPEWVEEVLLQSVLMLGYPRALAGFGAWRSGGAPAPPADPGAEYGQVKEWIRRGEAACRTVYGDNYDKLRANVRALHPALDAWMITEGYGRTVARPGLDLRRRELCIVAQMAVLDAPRQLHSHLRGALNAGATPAELDQVLGAVGGLMPPDQRKQVMDLWQSVRDARNGRD